MQGYSAASGAAVGSASFCIPARVNQTAGRSAAPSLLSLSLPLLNRLVPTFQPEKCTRGVYGDKTCAQYLFVILSQPDAHIIKLREPTEANVISVNRSKDDLDPQSQYSLDPIK